MPDAEKREKVIFALRYCRENRCGPECPYYYDDINESPADCVMERVVGDILSLLREQEPRVMSLEELQAIETPWNRNTPPYLFVEGRSATTESRWMSWGFMHDFVRLPGTIGVQNYGSKWRVWNLQPTPEQMRETKWEES